MKRVVTWMLAGVWWSAAALGVEHSRTAHEGPVEQAQIVVGPFDLHRKYRSMEGPWVRQTFRVADLVASQRVELPEAMVRFVEGNPQGGPSMKGGGSDGATAARPVGLVERQGSGPELYWFKGIRPSVWSTFQRGSTIQGYAFPAFGSYIATSSA